MFTEVDAGLPTSDGAHNICRAKDVIANDYDIWLIDIFDP